jgi:hydrogenase maturation protease
VRALRGELTVAADVVESAASGFALLEIFAGYDRAVIVDSIRTGVNPPGTILDLGFEDLGRVVAPSLHHAGIPELAAVAERLGLNFPAKTSVLAVEVAEPPTFGAPLSEPVAAAVGPLVRLVRARVELLASQQAPAGERDTTLCTTTGPSARS